MLEVFAAFAMPIDIPPPPGKLSWTLDVLLVKVVLSIDRLPVEPCPLEFKIIKAMPPPCPNVVLGAELLVNVLLVTVR